MCWWGGGGTQNARVVGGRQVYDGDVVVVGDTDREAEVAYDLLCRRHWMAGETGRAASTVAELVDQQD